MVGNKQIQNPDIVPSTWLNLNKYDDMKKKRSCNSNNSIRSMADLNYHLNLDILNGLLDVQKINEWKLRIC